MRAFAFLVVAVLGAPAWAVAQDGQTVVLRQAQDDPEPGRRVDATKLGVDLSRIRKQLVEAPPPEAMNDPLRLHFTVEVVGVAPKVDFLEGFNLDGPLSYGAPTHQDVLGVLTPQAFKSPVIPISGLAVAAAQKLYQTSKRKQCEAEIEQYRQLIMQGVAIAAPRCSR